MRVKKKYSQVLGAPGGDATPSSPFVFGGEDDEEDDEQQDVEVEIDTVEEDLALHGHDELIVKVSWWCIAGRSRSSSGACCHSLAAGE